AGLFSRTQRMIIVLNDLCSDAFDQNVLRPFKNEQQMESIQHFSLIFVSVLFKKDFKFFTEALLSMVFFLPLDVAGCVFHSGNTDAECAKTFLPGKALRS